MKDFFKVFSRTIGSYSLEERVLSIIAVLVLVFLVSKNVVSLISPQSVFAERGVYTEALINDKPTLINPVYTGELQANQDISRLVFTGLMKYDPNLQTFVDDLGKLSISEDKNEYLFTIREGVMWHDGEMLTVDDVVFTYQVIQDPAFQNQVLRANFDGVGVEKVDEKTMKFVLSRPNSFFVTNLNIGILPEHILGDIPVAELLSNDFNLKPVGTGPYQVEKPLELLEDGRQRVALTRNDDYYGEKPKIREIRFNIFPDTMAMMEELGSLNVVSKLPDQISSQIEGERFTTINYSLPQYTAVFFNTEVELLQDKMLRVALMKAIDKDSLLGNLTNKVRVDTPVMGLNQDDWIFKANKEEAAGALFDLGYKFKKDDDGEIVAGEEYRRDEDDNLLEVTLTVRQYNTGSVQEEETRKAVEFMINAWRDVGVKVEPMFLAGDLFDTALLNDEYQMILAGQNMGYNLDTFPFWHSSQTDGQNFANYTSFAADNQIEKIRETFDQEEMAERVEKLAEIIADDVPAIFLYRPNYEFVTDGKVNNVNLDGVVIPADRFSRIQEWCVGDGC